MPKRYLKLLEHKRNMIFLGYRGRYQGREDQSYSEDDHGNYNVFGCDLQYCNLLIYCVCVFEVGTGECIK